MTTINSEHVVFAHSLHKVSCSQGCSAKMEKPRAISCAGFCWSPTAYLQEPTGGAITKARIPKQKNRILLTSPRTTKDEPSSGPDLGFRAQNGGLGQKRPFCGGWGGGGLWGEGGGVRGPIHVSGTLKLQVNSNKLQKKDDFSEYKKRSSDFVHARAIHRKSGYSRSFHGVLTRFSRGSHGVLTRFSRAFCSC